MSQLICLFLSGFDECLSDLATFEMLFCRDFSEINECLSEFAYFRFSINVSSNFLVFIADITKGMLTIPSILCIFPL